MTLTQRSELIWSTKRFHELSTTELYDVLKIRVDIFVVEQECAYPEIDGKDPDCLHAIGKTTSGEIVASARIAPAGVIYDEWSIGRVVVKKSHRGRKLGNDLMQHSINYLKNNTTASTIKIAAQLYLERFYSELGFEKISGIYPWDGIDHIDMRLKLR
jgi:ElaA protein